MFSFSSLNQRYDIIISVYWFELFSQVSDVAHGPLVRISLQGLPVIIIMLSCHSKNEFECSIKQ